MYLAVHLERLEPRIARTSDMGNTVLHVGKSLAVATLALLQGLILIAQDTFALSFESVSVRISSSIARESDEGDRCYLLPSCRIAREGDVARVRTFLPTVLFAQPIERSPNTARIHGNTKSYPKQFQKALCRGLASAVY